MTDYVKALGFEGESDPAQDILTWAADKLPWVRDALRRLAVSGELSEVDKAELVGMIRKAQGLPVTVEPPAAIPLTAHHLGARGASTFSHDNPIAPTDPFPEPKEMEADLKELEDVVAWLKKHHDGVG